MPTNLKSLLFCAAFAMLAVTLTGCASGIPGSARLPDAPIALSSTHWKTCGSWKLPLPGRISNVSVTDDGSLVLVSTSAERRPEARARLINSHGKVIWTKGFAHPVKAQALSSDGRLMVLNTYDGKLQVYRIPNPRAARPRPKLAWVRLHLGRPLILEKQNRIVLLNDDDSEPRMAFASYDFAGTPKGTGMIDAGDEAVEMFASENGDAIIVILASGTMQAFRLDGKEFWKEAPEKQALAVFATQSGGQTAVVLTSPLGKNGKSLLQSLVGYSVTENAETPELTETWEVLLARRFESIAKAGEALILYGNVQSGQSVSSYDLNTGKELWQRSYSAPALYSSVLLSRSTPEPYVSIAIDDGTAAGILHFLAVNQNGQAVWDVPVRASSGIFSYAISQNGKALVVGAGEPAKGVLHHFSLESSQFSCKLSGR